MPATVGCGSSPRRAASSPRPPLSPGRAAPGKSRQAKPAVRTPARVYVTAKRSSGSPQARWRASRRIPASARSSSAAEPAGRGRRGGRARPRAGARLSAACEQSAKPPRRSRRWRGRADASAARTSTDSPPATRPAIVAAIPRPRRSHTSPRTEPGGPGGSSGADQLGEDALEVGAVLTQDLDRPRARRRAWRRSSRGATTPCHSSALEPEGRVDRQAGRDRQPRPAAEVDRPGPRTARVDAEADMVGALLAAEPDRILERRRRHEQRDRRVAGAERRQPQQLLRQVEAEVLARDDGVDALDADEIRRRQDRAAWPRTPRGRRRSAAGRSGARPPPGGRRGRRGARRRRAGRRAGRRPESTVPTRSPAAAGRVEGDHHGRAVVTLSDPGGDDADHAGMPAGAGEDVGRRVAVLAAPAPRPRSASASRRHGARRWPGRARRRSPPPAPGPR